jgi:hypothetical protein
MLWSKTTARLRTQWVRPPTLTAASSPGVQPKTGPPTALRAATRAVGSIQTGCAV